MKKIFLFVSFIFLISFIRSEILPDLKPILDAQMGNSVIEIPKGKYLLNLYSYRTYRFNNLTDVVINGNGSEIICNSQERAMGFYNCSRVKISDLTLDYDPLCFTQGSIVNMNIKKGWFEVEIDSGYPVENLSTSKVQFYDPLTREIKKNSITTYSSNYSELRKVADRRYRAIKNGSWTADEKIGDLVVFNVITTKPYPAPHAFYLENCTDMEVENITIYGSNSFSFFETGCSSTHYNYCVVTKRSSPAGVAPRLRAGNADGINCNEARIGPLVENCMVGYNGDDCIIVNGRSYPICKTDQVAKSIYILSRVDNPLFESGDTLQHVKYNGVKNDTIMKIVSLQPYTPTQEDISFVLSKYPNLLSKESYTKGLCINVNNFPANINKGDIVYNANRVGSGFIIRNNRVGNNRSRGLLIKSKNGLIESNEISNCAMNGILVSPEINWMGGGYADHIEIKNNTISGCMYERSNAAMPPGALSVFCETGDRKVALTGAFSEINIHDNTIKDCPYPSVVYTSINGVTYERNEIIKNINIERTHGQIFGVSFTTPVWEINNIYSIVNDTTVNNETKNISPYPNPVKENHFTIEEIKDQELKEIIIFDVHGKKIYQQKFQVPVKKNKFTLDFLQNGIYLVKLILNNNTVETIKIIN